MGLYNWKALDATGIPQIGEMEGDSDLHVAAKLRAQGLTAVQIARKVDWNSINVEIFARVKPTELALATRQLATMIDSGMSILRALTTVSEQADSRLLKTTMDQVAKAVDGGASLSEALGQHPKVFDRLYVSMVHAGEVSGTLDQVLTRIADQLEKDAALVREVRSAMVYPMIVFCFAIVVLLAMVAFIIPVFSKALKQFHGKLPSLTKFMMAWSHSLTNGWYFWIVGIVLLAFMQYWVRRNETTRPYWDRFRLKIPMRIGEVVQKVAIARWSRTLSSLVSAGVPLLQALEITGKTGGNSVIEEAMQNVTTSVRAGGTIAKPLRDAKVFPPMVSQMVEVGESSGTIDGMLTRIADFYEAEVTAVVKALTSILEPVMILLVGVVVGLVVISMYLPLFDVYNAIK
jgi:type IV pilus assembly protein PilC